MALTFNGTTVDKVVYNGTNLDKVICNGTTVWEGSVEITETVTASTFNYGSYSSTGTNGNKTDAFTLSHTPIGGVNGVSIRSATLRVYADYESGRYTRWCVIQKSGTNNIVSKSLSGNKLYVTFAYSAGSLYSSFLTSQPSSPKSVITVTYKYKP